VQFGKKEIDFIIEGRDAIETWSAVLPAAWCRRQNQTSKGEIEMNRVEDRILNTLEPRKRMTTIEVSAKSISNTDRIIDTIMAEEDVLTRLGLWEKLNKTVGSRAYITIRMRCFAKYGNTE